jgi:uncharacterized protein (TIGR03083 family)
MDDVRVLAALERVTSAMVSAVGEADPQAPVPGCPGWDVTTLVDHLGRVHLWAAQAARTGRRPDPYPRRDRSQPLQSWYAACAAELLATLRLLPPEHPAWTFFGPDQSVRFWRRRQVHETAVHLVDLRQAGGELGGGLVESLPWLSAAEAVDGVDEVLRVMAPRKLDRLAPAPAEELVPARRPVAFVATHGGTAAAAWTLRLSDGAVVVTDGVDADAVAVATAPAVHLDLVLWGRADRDRLAIEGEPAAVRRLLDASLVP